MTTVATITYSRTHSVTFVSNNIRMAIIRLLEGLKLKPDRLLSDWNVLGKAVETWLTSGHLVSVTIEFFLPGSSEANARWDIPVSYEGSGASDDMWLDRDHLARSIDKAKKPATGSVYRVILSAEEGRADIPGMVPTKFLSAGTMASRSAGTLIAAPDITAGLRYWGTAS